MFLEVPLLTRCCFCAPLRCGLLVWAYVKLVFNILVFLFSLIVLSTVGAFLFFCDCVYYILAVVLCSLILFFFDIIFNFVLIVGCHKNHTTLLRLYYRFGIVHAVFFLTHSIVTIALLLHVINQPGNEDTELWDFILILSTICCILLILHMYLVLLVRSEISRLKPNGHFQFVNHIADPKCVMEIDFMSKDISQEIIFEKPVS